MEETAAVEAVEVVAKALIMEPEKNHHGARKKSARMDVYTM
jgi:hypothetical protein